LSNNATDFEGAAGSTLLPKAPVVGNREFLPPYAIFKVNTYTILIDSVKLENYSVLFLSNIPGSILLAKM
jgi:hypothetical protein